MPSSGPETRGLEHRPLRELARDALRAQIAAIEAGTPCLRVPRVADQFDASKGNHFHLFPELFIQLGGMSVMRFPRETIRLTAGAALIVPRGMPHEETARSRPGPFCNLVVAYGHKSVGLHSAFQGDRHHPRAKEIDDLTHDESREIFRQLDEVADLSQHPGAHRSTAIKGLLLAHFAYLLDLLDRPPVSGQREPFRVLHCRRLVAQHLTNPDLNVRLLARWMTCSPDYLSHCFHTAAGITITRFINSRRILQAQSLLENSAMNVSEIARASGYRDPAYFTRVFRRTTHFTPRQFRRQLRSARVAE